MYLGEWIGRTIKQTEVLLGLLIDVSTLGLASLLGLHFLAAVLLALLFGVCILLWGSFVVFREERRRTKESIILRQSRFDVDVPEDLRRKARVIVYDNGTWHAYAPISFEFVSHTSDALLNNAEMLWIERHRFHKERVLKRIPYHSLGDYKGKFPMQLPAGQVSIEFVGGFEDSWPQYDRASLAKDFDWVIEVDVAGPPPFRTTFAEFRNTEWPKPPEDGKSWLLAPAKLNFE